MIDTTLLKQRVRSLRESGTPEGARLGWATRRGMAKTWYYRSGMPGGSHKVMFYVHPSSKTAGRYQVTAFSKKRTAKQWAPAYDVQHDTLGQAKTFVRRLRTNYGI